MATLILSAVPARNELIEPLCGYLGLESFQSRDTGFDDIPQMDARTRCNRAPGDSLMS